MNYFELFIIPVEKSFNFDLTITKENLNKFLYFKIPKRTVLS